jgi:hypothetical protein
MDKIKEGLYKKSPGIKKFVVLEFSKYQLKTYARTKKNKEKAESLKTWYYLDDRTIKEQGKKRVSGAYFLDANTFYFDNYENYYKAELKANDLMLTEVTKEEFKSAKEYSKENLESLEELYKGAI